MPPRPTTILGGAVPTRVHVSVYQPDGLTHIADIPRRSRLAWQEAATGDPGEGVFTIHQDDPLLVTHPTLLRKRNVVKLRYDLTKDAFYAFRIKRTTRVIVDNDEHAGQTITVSGPDITSWLEWGIVKPEGGVRPESPSDRLFGWMSAPGDWLVPADWPAAVGVLYKSATLGAKQNAPYQWPDASAQWIWPTDPTLSSPVGHAYFRKTFTLLAEQEVIFSASFDNAGIVYIDNMVLFGADDTRTWGVTYAVSVVLSAGTHTIGAEVYNREGGGAGATDNPGGLIFAAHSALSDGQRGTSLFRSDTSWQAYNAEPPPAWPRAEILATCIEEAQARNAAGVKELTVGFTALADSFGFAWPADQGVVTVRVGDTCLQVKQQLSALGDFDVWMDYENRVLHAAPERGLDLSGGGGVALTRRVNLLRWQVDEEDEIRNKPLVRYDGGWIELTEPTSVTAWGATETLLDIGSAQTPERATLIAEAAYGILANPQAYGQSGEQRVDGNRKPEGSLIAVAGAVPWGDFFPGDYVSAYAGDGSVVKAWVVSMAGAEDSETGELTFDPELQDASGDFVKRPPLNVVQRFLFKEATRFKGQDAVQPAYQIPGDYVYGGGYNGDAATTGASFGSNARRPGAPGSRSYETGYGSSGAGLHVGPEAPTDGSKFWYDTDAPSA